MKKYFFYLAVAVMTIFFIACNKNNLINGSLEIIEGNATLSIKAIKVQNGNSEIASAKIILQTFKPTHDGDMIVYTATYKNGGFELNIPATIPEGYLSPASNILIFEDNILLSDTQAKTTSFSIGAHNSTETNIGGFSFSSGKWNLGFVYADRSFTEKGISKGGLEYDCSYKKGWNIVYWYWSEKNSIKTTQSPKNEKFICSFSPNVAL